MAKKDIDGEIHVQLIVNRLAPDRTPYKVYGMEFVPHRTLVSVPVSSEHVTVTYVKDPTTGKDTKEIDFVVLSLDGLMEITGHIADKVDVLHKKHLNSAV